ncbi:MAG: DJ-1/PfpI family protein [bacterium]
MRRPALILSILALLIGQTILVGGQPKLQGKKILMIIARNGFRDEEYQIPREILEGEGASITVASSSLNPAKGMLGSVVKPDIPIDDVDAADYDALIFVGGVGASEYWESERAHSIAKEALDSGKVVCAICIAPVTLAKAGILKGRRATVWWSEGGRLKSLGAIYTGRPVERDGKIITANGPGAAGEFAEAITKALSE